MKVSYKTVNIGSVLVAEWVKQLLAMLASHIGASLSPGDSTVDLAPCEGVRGNSERWTKSLGSCTHMGDTGKAPGSFEPVDERSVFVTLHFK